MGIDTEKYSLQDIIMICESTIEAFKNANEEERRRIIKECNETYGFDDLYFSGPRLVRNI